ncbi:MAG: hypothetical protein Kow0020_10620 [Wenzhouxiangellaceae bacterium]
MTIDTEALAARLRTGLLDQATPLAEGHQGCIHRLEFQGRSLAIKSATGRGLRGLANRLALRREARAYRRLSGVAGIPACHGLIDGRWLVLDHIEVRPFRDGPRRDDYFDRLLTIIEAMHARGVAHGDLKRKSNLGVDAEGAPVLLDFGASVVRRAGWHPLNRRLFEWLAQTDLNAWVKHKHSGYTAVTGTDRIRLKRTWPERLAAALRRRN